MVATILCATTLPLFNADAWWIRVFDFPRTQLLVLAGMTMVALSVTPGLSGRVRWGGIIAVAVCFILQASLIAPYTPIYPSQVRQRDKGNAGLDVRVLVSNVLMENRNSAPLLERIDAADPDIIAIVEPDRWWQEQLGDLPQTHPYTVLVPQDNTYGLLVYSRLPLRSSQVQYLVEPDVPSVFAEVELGEGRTFDLYILHPRPPAPTESSSTENRDAELLLVGKQVKERGRPAIVAGDLNDVAWSSTTALFQKISGLLDPRIGRGLFSTYNAHHWFLRWPLDHIFHSEDFYLVSLERLDSVESDHFPIFSHLVFSPSASVQHEKPDADAEDRTRAEEKIAKPFEDSSDTNGD